jgi:5-methyltetrahydrofolate--homocysteine methyltransferase
MTRDFLSAIKRKPLLFDGAIGTQLQAKGLPVGEAPEKWNLEFPELVQQVHEEYVRAGADAVTTNSFGASPYKLKNLSLDNRAFELNFAAARIARKAAGEAVFVAGSVGPTGAIMILGEVSEAEILAGFEIQIQGLVRGGADVIIIETMSDLAELELALKAGKNTTDLPLIASMTYAPGANGYKTMMGVDIKTAVRESEKSGADLVATNCGVGIDSAIEIIGEMRSVTNLPILAEPNAGLPRLVDGKTIYAESAEKMAEKIPLLLVAGAQVIGGCCGTTPEHIRMFREVIDSYE